MNIPGTPPLVTLDIPVRWGDMDALGHVNNTRFLTFLEETRLAWFDRLEDNWVDATAGPVMASVNCNFRRPIVWPATVRVSLWVKWSGGRSVLTRHLIRDAGDPDTVYADADIILVWVDRQSGKAIELPQAVRDAAT